MACPSPRALVVLTLLTAPVLACQRVPSDQLPDIEEETETGTGTGTGEAPPTGGPVDEGGDVMAPAFDCEPVDEKSCPTGEKCSAISQGGAQNHFTCVPDDSELLPGDDCTPAQGTGQDGCTTGHVCLVSDIEDSQGRCFQGCRNDNDCEPAACEISPYTLTNYCTPSCDPLVPDCDPGLACRQSEDRFVCGMNLDETDIGQPGDPCDPTQLRGCAENLACMPGALIPGCAAGSCCTSVCDLAAGDEQCTSPTLCRPLFENPAPGFEAIGACFVPA